MKSAQREQLERAIQVIEAQRAALGDAVVDTMVAAAREKSAALQTSAAPLTNGGEQRSQGSVLLASVGGLAALTESLGAEAVKDIKHILAAQLTQAAVEHGGQVEQLEQDVFAVLWTAKENAPERAIRAALALQEMAREFAPGAYGRVSLQMRIGIDSGLIALDQERAAGGALEVSKHLLHTAPVGSILISHNTYRHVRGIFDVQSLGLTPLKNTGQAMQLYLVQRAKARAIHVGTRGVEGIETCMVGRKAELQYLQDMLYSVTDGERQMVTVLGQAGMGKSRLLYEFENWVDLRPELIRYFKGRASQETQDSPFALVRSVFAMRFEIRNDDSLPVVRQKMEAGIARVLGNSQSAKMRAHFIGQLIGYDFDDSPYLQDVLNDAQELRARATSYTSEYFRAATAQTPAFIIFEDIHWADDNSLDVINHLAMSTQDHRLMILCLARPALLQRRPEWSIGQTFHRRLELKPLSKRHTRRLVEEILQRVEQLPEALCELIVSKAEGNPLYVEELTKWLIELGVILKSKPDWRVEPARLAAARVPPTLQEILQTRLDSLSSSERALLQLACVLGRTFWGHAIEWMSQQASKQDAQTSLYEDIVGALAAAQDREIVFQRETSAFGNAQEYIFKHNLVRDVIYAGLTDTQRQSYHRLVAEWLQMCSSEREREHTDLIAWHLALAG